MIIVGIDPGNKGGIAAINNRGKLIHAEPMPKSAGLINKLLCEIIYNSDDTEVWIEKAQPHRTTKDHKEGITQIFSTGYNYGKIKTIAEVLKYRAEEWGRRFHIEEVYPLTWKSAFKLSKDKELSMKMCMFLYPESKDLIYCEKGGALDGVAEAILIAYYGYLNYDRRLDKRYAIQ